MTEGNDLILETIAQLQNTTEAITDSTSKMTSYAQNLENSEVELSELSAKVEESINRIGNEIDEFHI